MSDNDRNENTRSHIHLQRDTKIGHYQIIEKIGAGGMGEVYLATDTRLKRDVALKFLPAHLCHDEECRKRFKREAQAAANLNHPNVVVIYEVSEYEGRPFFAMELVRGKSLKEVIAEGSISIAQALQLTSELADGLQVAHEAGVIHRDIKPSNIVIDKKSRPKLIDFGLAAVSQGDKITQTGSTLGTVGYMSPEQIRGEEVDRRSDVFSLGVVLYELITGHHPFLRATDTATYRAVLEETQHPLAKYRSDIPEGLQGIVDKALEKDVHRRYQHVDELRADLIRESGSLQQVASIPRDRKPSRKKSRRLLMPSAILIAIAAVAVLLLTRPWSDDSAEPVARSDRIMLAVLPFENLGNPEDEYFADGMTEEIISRLASVSGLGVISRTSVIGYKGTTKSIGQIGRELGVEYILEGTVRYDKSSDTPRVRITPQLIRVADDVHLWADQVEMPLENIFQAQAQIARDIVNALDVRLVRGEPEWIEYMPTHSTEAYQLLLQSRFVSGLQMPFSKKLDSIRFLVRRALELDSNIVIGWVIISVSNSMAYHYGHDRSEERLLMARDAATRALELDPNSDAAHFAMGEFYYRCKRDYNRALAEFEQVKSSRGTVFDPTPRIAWILRRSGKFSQALDKQLADFRLHPRDAGLAEEIAVTYKYLGNCEKAAEYYQKSMKLASNVRDFKTVAARNIVYCTGDLAASRALLEEAPRAGWTDLASQCLLERDLDGVLQCADSAKSHAIVSQAAYWPMSLLRAIAYRELKGDTAGMALFEQARQALEKVLPEMPDDFRAHDALALAYAGLGMKAEALEHAHRAIDLCPVKQDAMLGRGRLLNLVNVQIFLGEYEEAIDGIEELLRMGHTGYHLTIPILKIDPLYDPLRDYPQFKKLVES